jgi:hypothetical protein
MPAHPLFLMVRLPPASKAAATGHLTQHHQPETRPPRSDHRGGRFHIPPKSMDILELWPWALLLGLAVFAFFLLGPFLAGLLLILVIIVSVANLISR